MVDLAVKIRDRLSADTFNVAGLVGFNFLAVAQYVAGDQSFLRASQMADPSHASRLDGHVEIIRVVDSAISSDGFDRILEAMHNMDPAATDPLADKAALIASFPATLTSGDHSSIAVVGGRSESIETTQALMTQASSAGLHQVLGHDGTHAAGVATKHSMHSSSASQSEQSSLGAAPTHHGAENSHQLEGYGLGMPDHGPDQTSSHGVSSSSLSSTSAVLLTSGSMFDNFEGADRSVQSAAHLDRASSNDTPGSVIAGSSSSFFNDMHAAMPLQTSSQASDIGLGTFYQDTDNDSPTGYSQSVADQAGLNASDSAAVSKSNYPLPSNITGENELHGIGGGLGSTTGFNTTGSLVTVSAIKPTTVTLVDVGDPDVQKVIHTGSTPVSPIMVSVTNPGSSGVGGDGHSGVGTASGGIVDPTGGSSGSGAVGVTATSPAAGTDGSGIAGGTTPPAGSGDGATSAGGVPGAGVTGSAGGVADPSHAAGGAGDQTGGAQPGGSAASPGTGVGAGTGSSSGTVSSASGAPGPGTDHHSGDAGGDQAGTGTSAGPGSSGVGGDGHSGVGTASGGIVDPTGGSSGSGAVGVTATSPAAGTDGSGIAGGTTPPAGSGDGATSAGGVPGAGVTGSAGGVADPSHAAGGAGDQTGGAQPGGSSGVGGDGHSGVDAGTGLLQGDALAQLRDNLLKQISGLLAWHSTHTPNTLPTADPTSPGTSNPPSVVQQAPGNGDGGNPLVAHTTPDVPHVDGSSLAQERADLMRLHDTLMQQAFGAEAKVQASVSYAQQASAKAAAVLQPAPAMLTAMHTGLDASLQDEHHPAMGGEYHDPASSTAHHDLPQEHHQPAQDLHSHSYDDAHHLGAHAPYYDHF